MHVCIFNVVILHKNIIYQIRVTFELILRLRFFDHTMFHLTEKFACIDSMTLINLKILYIITNVFGICIQNGVLRNIIQFSLHNLKMSVRKFPVINDSTNYDKFDYLITAWLNICIYSLYSDDDYCDQ